MLEFFRDEWRWCLVAVVAFGLATWAAEASIEDCERRGGHEETSTIQTFGSDGTVHNGTITTCVGAHQ